MRNKLVTIALLFFSYAVHGVVPYSQHLSCRMQDPGHVMFSYEMFDLYLQDQYEGKSFSQGALIDNMDSIDRASYKGVRPKDVGFQEAKLELSWEEGNYTIFFSRTAEGAVQGLLSLGLQNEHIDIVYDCGISSKAAIKNFHNPKQLACNYQKNLPYNPPYNFFTAYSPEYDRSFKGDIYLKHQQAGVSKIDMVPYVGWAPHVANNSVRYGKIGHADIPFGKNSMQLNFFRTEEGAFYAEAESKIARANLKFSYSCHL